MAVGDRVDSDLRVTSRSSPWLKDILVGAGEGGVRPAGGWGSFFGREFADLTGSGVAMSEGIFVCEGG